MLKLVDVHFSYDKREVLKGIHLDVGEGSFIGLIGPNGSGKSTLLKSISGYLKPSKGKVLLNGIDISAMDIKARARHIGYVPQDTSIDFDFTCEDIVRMGRMPYHKWFGKETEEDRKAVEHAMRVTNTWHMKDVPITHLSGGERQRVLIARAICQQPEVLLLDEPVSHLDIKYQYDIMDMVSRLSRCGMTVIAVLHDLSLASQYCRDIALICDGMVIASGSPQEVITAENIKKAYRADVLIMPNPVNGMPVVVPSQSKEGSLSDTGSHRIRYESDFRRSPGMAPSCKGYKRFRIPHGM
ncbi:ABC transporter ATP-binding protein [Caldanaerobius polysaccharolyticus]|uniref:ABC transporter ATP-binding protein n=1 Tax=Caldanaerobius polysaccharolyticus TaxID=44256 RepID=UPI0009FCBF6F|nr:ABC transporter ATP-binding protein [Caldanaerobius polysaccharolyticus]